MVSEGFHQRLRQPKFKPVDRRVSPAASLIPASDHLRHGGREGEGEREGERASGFLSLSSYSSAPSLPSSVFSQL